MLTGIATIFFVRETTHWMEGLAIAILVVFMPLTAISYLVADRKPQIFGQAAHSHHLN
jgi:hypothetical protein